MEQKYIYVSTAFCFREKNILISRLNNSNETCWPKIKSNLNHFFVVEIYSYIFPAALFGYCYWEHQFHIWPKISANLALFHVWRRVSWSSIAAVCYTLFYRFSMFTLIISKPSQRCSIVERMVQVQVVLWSCCVFLITMARPAHMPVTLTVARPTQLDYTLNGLSDTLWQCCSNYSLRRPHNAHMR